MAGLTNRTNRGKPVFSFGYVKKIEKISPHNQKKVFSFKKEKKAALFQLEMDYTSLRRGLLSCAIHSQLG